MTDRFHTKAAYWILRLPERRSDLLDAGCKVVLQAHWNCVDPDVERDASGSECWPTAEAIAHAIGSTESAVVDRRRKLIAAGWMRRDGAGWALAWQRPLAVLREIGCVYALEFSSGTVKVGKTKNADRRLAEHEAAAACFGLSILRRWVSVEHEGCDQTERMMIETLRESQTSLNGGEFFDGGFDEAVESALERTGGGAT